jgi:hypothetical protein
VKTAPKPGLLPHFPELLPLGPENQRNGARKGPGFAHPKNKGFSDGGLEKPEGGEPPCQPRPNPALSDGLNKSRIKAPSMVNTGQQLRVRRAVERLFAKSSSKPVAGFEMDLAKLGFVQTGGDPIILAFENPVVELALEITLGVGQLVHSYQVMSFAERTKRQQKFRY